MADIELKALPPQEAVDYFRAKGLIVTSGWQSLWQDEHARAFTVACLSSLDLLQDIKDALDKAIANGTSLDQFKKDLIPKLEAGGWWGEGKGQLTPSRLALIYDTNLRTAYATSQWGRIQRLKKRMPYLRYNKTSSARPREQHLSWVGIVRPVDDGWWDTHFPPNGWRCKCSATQLSAGDLDDKGLEVTPDDHMPPSEMVSFTNRATGEVSQVPKGIDPGWAYNAGKAGQAALLERASQKLAGYSPDLAQQGVNALVQGPPFTSWFQQPQGNFPVMVLPEGTGAAISATTEVVVLSPPSLAKNQVNHPELVLDDYRQLPVLGADPDYIILKDGFKAILVKTGDAYLVAVIKAAQAGGRETFLVSFRYTNAADLAALLRSGEILYQKGGAR